MFSEQLAMYYETVWIKLLTMGVELGSGNWTVDGNKLTITMEGDVADCPFRSGEITIKEQGMSVTLGK